MFMPPGPFINKPSGWRRNDAESAQATSELKLGGRFDPPEFISTFETKTTKQVCIVSTGRWSSRLHGYPLDVHRNPIGILSVSIRNHWISINT